MIKQFFTINWRRFNISLLPPILRKGKQVAWINTLLQPLQTLYDDILYRMQHNGQIVYMEKVLNEAFNPTRPYIAYKTTQEKANNNLIFINDSYRPSPQYVYLHSEILTGKRPIKVYLHDTEFDNMREYEYFLSLSNEADFKSFEYFNFKINIPEVLGQEYQEKLDFLLDQIVEGQDNTSIKNDILKLRNTDLNYRDIEDAPNPNSVFVNTPRFHDLVNYYRIAAKSYETQIYQPTAIATSTTNTF